MTIHKTFLAVAAAFAAVMLSGVLYAAAPEVGKPAHEIKPDKTWNDGGKKSLSEFKEGYVLLVFWATW